MNTFLLLICSLLRLQAFLFYLISQVKYYGTSIDGFINCILDRRAPANNTQQTLEAGQYPEGFTECSYC